MRTSLFALLAFCLADQTPAGQEPKPKPDPEAILGSWSIVGLETAGKPESEKHYRGNTFTFTKDKATLLERGYPPVEFTYTLDPTQTPRRIDLTAGKGGAGMLKGIYKLEGDELVLCLSLGGTRPTEFATKAGGDTETFTLRRIRWERFTDQATGISVEFPGKPEEWARKMRTPAGEWSTTFFVVRHDADRVSYLVSITPLPRKPTGKEADAVLEVAQRALVAEVDKAAKATVVAEGKFKPPLGVDVGKELTIALEAPGAGDPGAMRVRLFIAGDRLYSLAAAGVEEGIRSANVNRFWNSFRLPDDKKEPPRKQ